MSKEIELLCRIRGWDHLDNAADGSYWKGEIDKVLAIAALQPAVPDGTVDGSHRVDLDAAWDAATEEQKRGWERLPAAHAPPPVSDREDADRLDDIADSITECNGYDDAPGLIHEIAAHLRQPDRLREAGEKLCEHIKGGWHAVECPCVYGLGIERCTCQVAVGLKLIEAWQAAGGTQQEVGQ